MSKRYAVVVLADTEGFPNFGRMANALELTRALRERGKEVELVLTGAGVKWPVFMHEGKGNGDEFAAHYGAAFEGANPLACLSCGMRYGVLDRLKSLGVRLAGEPPSLLSLADLVAEGYSVITF